LHQQPQKGPLDTERINGYKRNQPSLEKKKRQKKKRKGKEKKRKKRTSLTERSFISDEYWLMKRGRVPKKKDCVIPE